MNNTDLTPTAYATALFAKIGVANSEALLASASENHRSALGSVDVSLWTTVQDHQAAERAYVHAMANLTEYAQRSAEQISTGDGTYFAYADTVTSYANQAAEQVAKMKSAHALITTLLSIRKSLV